MELGKDAGGSVIQVDSGPHAVWQDREIRFDASVAELEMRRGEFTIDSLDSVEDTKGNNGDRGDMMTTNLRVMWVSQKNPRVNLSIGYATVVGVKVQATASRLRGSQQALYVLTKVGTSRFEFIFTNIVAKGVPRLFGAIQAVHHAYDGSRLYRDLKLRGAIIADKELKLLPLEQLYSKALGVMNLSSDQGNLGTLFVTNVRLVWFANLADNFNVSVPYPQIKSVRIRDSKFGPALVIETSQRSGGYILGFRVDPLERLKEVFKELHALWQVFAINPVFGVEYAPEEAQPAVAAFAAARAEDASIVDDAEDTADVFAAYSADGDKATDREVVYSRDLGLAIEALREGSTIDQLWLVA